jgi:endothelin-converting enzyme
MTPRCVLLSATILSSLDTSQDPCENFYQFANGGWLGTHLLPPDRGSYDQFDVASERNTRLIREILQFNHSHFPSAPPINTDDSIDAELDYDTLILGKLRSLYRSCLDEKLLNYLGQDPLMHVLRMVKKLFRENITHVPIPGIGEMGVNEEESVNIHDSHGVGLTNALAYMHSKGVLVQLP